MPMLREFSKPPGRGLLQPASVGAGAAAAAGITVVGATSVAGGLQPKLSSHADTLTGDLLLLANIHDSNFFDPSGWTNIFDETTAASDRATLYHRTATSDGATEYTMGGTGMHISAHVLLVLRNAAVPTEYSITGTGSATCPSLADGVVGDLVLGMLHQPGDAGTPTVDPDFEGSEGTVNVGEGMHIGWKTLTAAGATETFTYTGTLATNVVASSVLVHVAE